MEAYAKKSASALSGLGAGAGQSSNLKILYFPFKKTWVQMLLDSGFFNFDYFHSALLRINLIVH